VSDLELILALAMLVGLVGVIVPILPGLILIAAAGIVWAIAQPRAGHWAVVGIMAGIAIAGVAASTLLPARRATSAGASRTAMAAGAIGMIVGFFAIPVVGALVGFPAGVFAGELWATRDASSAWGRTLATIKGVGLGIVIQLAAGVAMIGIWLAAVLLD
jgi:uncharacterized protein YqgC (DUF456 family)